MKKILKPVASLNYFISKKKYESNELREGVSAVVVARNESYNLPIVLESLIGFADQIICIDNGSDDNSLMKMKSFQEKFSHQVQIDVIEAPGRLLGDCRNIGLQHSKFNWHLRWDADMVFRQQIGKYNSQWLKEKIKHIHYPTAIKLARINLSGDFHHMSSLFANADEGEFFLVRRTKNLKYTEHEKFDVLGIPLFYDELKIPEVLVFHLEKLKSLDRIIYRNEYFAWRKSVITSNNTQDFESFRNEYRMKLFGISNPDSVKYRFHKKFIILNSAPIDMKLYGPYPEQIQKVINEGNERFSYKYENGKAVARLDKEDSSLENYIPTKEDLEWDIIAHLKNILSEKEQKKIGI
ncbi:hypothetical protein LBMAG27_24850 [Bacteroidota bacterium]|nr:hypothetical protein LBMAG27_24850 [Bacteroidota bacterium]